MYRLYQRVALHTIFTPASVTRCSRQLSVILLDVDNFVYESCCRIDLTSARNRLLPSLPLEREAIFSACSGLRL